MKESKITNLKTDYNLRGEVAEAIAREKIANLDHRGFLFEYDKKLRQDIDFVRSLRGVDHFSIEKDEVILYEIKSKNIESKNKFDLCEWRMESYLKAIANGIKVKVFIVYFHKDWNISFKIKDFKKSMFKVNNGGYYKRGLLY